ncbi:hypothetical protein GGR50DRAFT_690834 [Xylaria sp. CBS 124048]|nr:hypothetical protein GGR50DRAFT_690834 [Xylaria sp. CBS 124048]
MSALAPEIPGVSSDITYLTPEPFEPKPLIADILRTRFCIPDSIFLIEGVDVAHTSKSKKWRAIRLMLGDGELCIQALLSAEMHRFVDRGEIAFGSYVKLQQFSLELRDVVDQEGALSRGNKDAAGGLTDKTEQMVYLVVESLEVVGWNNTLTDAPMNEEPVTSQDSYESIDLVRITPTRPRIIRQPRCGRHGELEDIEDNDFEVMDVPELRRPTTKKG